MAKSLNRVTLIGNLGADPELRSTPQGTSVATISIATTENYKDKNGEWQENTEWHRIVLWSRLADIAGEYLKKGNKVYIEGKLQTRNYEDKDGVTRYITEIKATNMILLTPKDTADTDITADKNDDTSNDNSNTDDDVPF
jgi:single-strand DNA-binding protein